MSLPEGPTSPLHRAAAPPARPAGGNPPSRGGEGRGGPPQREEPECGTEGVAGPPRGSSEAQAHCPGLASLGPQGRVGGRAAHTATAEAGEEGGDRRASLSSGQGFLGSLTQAIPRILFV